MTSLSKLPKTFDLGEDAEKLYFPYLYSSNKYLNLERTGLPHARYYGMDQRSAKDKQAFYDWYTLNRNQPFCLKTALVEYCEQVFLKKFCNHLKVFKDVRILREACVRFRAIIKNLTGLDPFTCAVTASKLTMTIFQSKFLDAGVLVSVPENGYRQRQNQSVKARKFFRLLQQINKVTIRSAESAEGELSVKIGDSVYWIDGVVKNFLFLNKTV